MKKPKKKAPRNPYALSAMSRKSGGPMKHKLEPKGGAKNDQPELIEEIRESVCRCGWDGKGEHPCHYNAYACRKPAKQRFYNAQLTALPGMSLKFNMSETWACDECWDEFKKSLPTKAPKEDDDFECDD